MEFCNSLREGIIQLKKAIKIVVIILAVIALLVGGLYLGTNMKIKAGRKHVPITGQTAASQGADRLHFLSTGSSDCILIESQGHFALVDAGEDSEFPADRPNLELTGFEEDVVNYIKKVAADENGKVTLDFVLGTHAHSDHIGGFDTVINDPDITVLKGYLKEYHAANILDSETKNWDNQEVYDQMMAAMEANGVEIIQDLTNVEFTMGSFKIKLYNGETDFETKKKIGENENSVVTVLQKGDKTAALTGDLNYLDGDEKRLAPEIGKVDLLKPGHHGYLGSSSFQWVRALDPEIVVVTNYQRKMYPDVMFKFAFVSNSAMYCTADEGGVIATFTDDGQITLTNGIM